MLLVVVIVVSGGSSVGDCGDSGGTLATGGQYTHGTLATESKLAVVVDSSVSVGGG